MIFERDWDFQDPAPHPAVSVARLVGYFGIHHFGATASEYDGGIVMGAKPPIRKPGAFLHDPRETPDFDHVIAGPWLERRVQNVAVEAHGHFLRLQGAVNLSHVGRWGVFAGGGRDFVITTVGPMYERELRRGYFFELRGNGSPGGSGAPGAMRLVLGKLALAGPEVIAQTPDLIPWQDSPFKPFALRLEHRVVGSDVHLDCFARYLAHSAPPEVPFGTSYQAASEFETGLIGYTLRTLPDWTLIMSAVDEGGAVWASDTFLPHQHGFTGDRVRTAAGTPTRFWCAYFSELGMRDLDSGELFLRDTFDRVPEACAERSGVPLFGTAREFGSVWSRDAGALPAGAPEVLSYSPSTEALVAASSTGTRRLALFQRLADSPASQHRRATFTAPDGGTGRVLGLWARAALVAGNPRGYLLRLVEGDPWEARLVRLPGDGSEELLATAPATVALDTEQTLALEVFSSTAAPGGIGPPVQLWARLNGSLLAWATEGLPDVLLAASDSAVLDASADRIATGAREGFELWAPTGSIELEAWVALPVSGPQPLGDIPSLAWGLESDGAFGELVLPVSWRVVREEVSGGFESRFRSGRIRRLPRQIRARRRFIASAVVDGGELAAFEAFVEDHRWVELPFTWDPGRHVDGEAAGLFAFAEPPGKERVDSPGAAPVYRVGLTLLERLEP